MRITVQSDDGGTLWFRDCLTDNPYGMTSRSYLVDGTQTRIVTALIEALEQANAQLCGEMKKVEFSGALSVNVAAHGDEVIASHTVIRKVPTSGPALKVIR